jgi:hypothetical protein
MDATANNPDLVRQRAFQLWEQRGTPDGYEAEFWLQAERELKGENTESLVSTNASTAKSGGGSDGPV